MPRSESPANLVSKLGLVACVVTALLLGGCGSEAPGADAKDFPYWQKRFAEGDVQAMDRLTAMGTQAVPMLNQLLSDANETVVSSAAMAVGQLGADGAGTVGALLGALERFPGQAFVVQAIKGNAEAAIPQIVTLLETSNPTMQAQAAKLLNGIKTDRKAAVRPLLAILATDAPETTKIEAMGALASIGLDADAEARPVLEQIQAGGGELGKFAGRAIKRLDSAQKLAEIRGER